MLRSYELIEFLCFQLDLIPVYKKSRKSYSLFTMNGIKIAEIPLKKGFNFAIRLAEFSPQKEKVFAKKYKVERIGKFSFGMTGETNLQFGIALDMVEAWKKKRLINAEKCHRINWEKVPKWYKVRRKIWI